MPTPTVMQHCVIQPSRILRAAVRTLSIVAAFGLFMADVAWWLQASGLLLVAVCARHGLRRLSPTTVRCLSDGGMQVNIDGQWQMAALGVGSLVTPCFCVLRLAMGNRTKTVMVLGDSLAAGEFRRLRAWLRWKAAEASV